MGRKFRHLNIDDRRLIRQLINRGSSLADIAGWIGVNKSTISREIKRGEVGGVYDPDYAEALYQMKQKESGPDKVVETVPGLADFISKCILEEEMSPESIEALLKEDDRFSNNAITTPTIYYAIYTGSIPGVTKATLRQKSKVTMYSDGQISIPKWIREDYGFNDGDVFRVEVAENGAIILKKMCNIRKTG